MRERSWEKKEEGRGKLKEGEISTPVIFGVEMVVHLSLK